MTLADRQRAFRGLTFGRPGPYRLRTETGVREAVNRSGSRPAPFQHGWMPGGMLADGRYLTTELIVVGAPETTEQALDALQAAWAPVRPDRQFQWRFKDPGASERFMWVRPSRLSAPRTVETITGVWTEVTAELEAADPGIYSVDSALVIVPIFSVDVSGVSWNLDWDFSWGDPPVASVGEATNLGNSDAHPRVVFQHVAGATATRVTLTSLRTGQVVDVETAIAGGQQLVVDVDAAQRSLPGVLYCHIDGSDRINDWLLPHDFALPAGLSRLRLDVEPGGVEVACSVTWRHTWGRARDHEEEAA